MTIVDRREKFRTFRFGCLCPPLLRRFVVNMSAKSIRAQTRTTIASRRPQGSNKKNLSSTRGSSSSQSQRRRKRLVSSSFNGGGDDIIIIQNEIIKEAEPLLSQSSSFSDSLLEAGIEPWQLYFGFFAGIAPFIIAAYEFGKRILIQRKCALCQGSGLIRKGEYSRKCTACGGFLPWESWERFLDVGTAAKIGNGGRVRVPEGQTSVFYDVEKTVLASEKRKAVLEEESSLRRVAAAENPPAVEDKRKESSTK